MEASLDHLPVFITDGCISHMQDFAGIFVIQREGWSCIGHQKWEENKIFLKATKKFWFSRLQHKDLCGMYACNVYARNIMQNLLVALRSCFMSTFFFFFSVICLSVSKRLAVSIDLQLVASQTGAMREGLIYFTRQNYLVVMDPSLNLFFPPQFERKIMEKNLTIFCGRKKVYKWNRCHWID